MAFYAIQKLFKMSLRLTSVTTKVDSTEVILDPNIAKMPDISKISLTFFACTPENSKFKNTIEYTYDSRTLIAESHFFATECW